MLPTQKAARLISNIMRQVQIERDAESGKLDFLIEEAFAEKEQGRLKEL